jgi:uncharacterized protein YdeI (YjbR/CyaY-like superfamily)
MSPRPRSGRTDMLIDHTDLPDDVLVVPPALAERLDADEHARHIFERLSYEEQRAYVLATERTSPRHAPAATR